MPRGLPERRVRPLTFEAYVGVPHQRRAVLVHVRRSRRDDCEAVVGRRHARGLDRPAEDVVDEGRLARGVVADEEDERQ